MRPVARDEILDLDTYAQLRDELRPASLEAKRRRTVYLGRYLALLFENRETVAYQVHEMIRVERLRRAAEVQHELDTYNELLGADGELGCTLMVGIDDPALRDVLLARWLKLTEHLYLRLPDGSRVRPTWDPRQVGAARLSSVQFLKFDTGGVAPLAAGCDFDDEEIGGEVALDPDVRAALAQDLADAGGLSFSPGSDRIGR